MQDDLREEYVKTLWQNQSTEKSTMSMITILVRQKARTLQSKTRRQLLGSLAAPAVVAFLYVFCLNQFHQLREAEHVLFGLALGWSIVGVVLLNRGKWSAEVPHDMGLSTGLEFCRRQIERRRDYFHRVMLWQLAPIILAIGTPVIAFAMGFGRALLPKAVPFLILLAVWIMAYLLVVTHQRHELRRELEELREIENENSR